MFLKAETIILSSLILLIPQSVLHDAPTQGSQLGASS